MFVSDCQVLQGVWPIELLTATHEVQIAPADGAPLHLDPLSNFVVMLFPGDAPPPNPHIVAKLETAPASPFSASTQIDFFPTIYAPDLPPPQPKNIWNDLQASNQFLSDLNDNNLFEANSAAFVVMLSPSDAPPPNPPH